MDYNQHTHAYQVYHAIILICQSQPREIVSQLFFFPPTLMITNISFSLTGDKSTIVVTPSLTDFKGVNMYISDYNVLKFFKVSQGIITKWSHSLTK